MKKMTMAVIGGGSVNWMRGLMKDVYLMDGVDGGEIRLVDPNVSHVTSVRNMLLKFNELTGKTFRISVVENRLDALRGCDFVLTTFSPGAMEAFYNDLEIPVKYGVRLPVSMTCGISGISAALRTVPVAYEIVRDMEKVCPGATLINVTNPMACVTKAMYLPARTVRVYGLCHGAYDLGGILDQIFGLKKPEGMPDREYMHDWLPKQGFDYTIAGLNHFIFLIRAVWNGRDVLEDIRRYAKEHDGFSDSGAPMLATNIYLSRGKAALAMCRQLGYLHIPGDRHLIEFWPSLCNIQNGFGMKYGVQKTTVDSRRLDKVLQQRYIDQIAGGEIPVTWQRSSEAVSDIMHDTLYGKEMLLVSNMPNEGQIENLPTGTVVETIVRKEADGRIVPIPAGPLPEPIRLMCSVHATVNDMVTQAALQGDRTLLIQAMSLDPTSATMDFGSVPNLCEELLQANRAWLPRFFD